MTSPLSSADFLYALRALPQDSLAASRATIRQMAELSSLDGTSELSTSQITADCQRFLNYCVHVLRKHLPASICSSVASLYPSLKTRDLEKLYHGIISDKDDECVWQLIAALVETTSNSQILVPSPIQDTPHRRNTNTLSLSVQESGRSQITHADINPYLREELNGNTFFDSKDFFDTFFPAKPCVSRLFQEAITSGIYNTDKGWVQWPATPHQNDVLRFV